MIPRSPTERSQALRGGVVAGIASALALTSMMTVMSLARGTDIWFGIKGASAPFLGERAMQPGFDLLPVWLGFVVHLAVSVGWAVPFALIAYGSSRWKTIAAGAAWGIPVWLGMYYLVLPMVGLAEMAAQAPVVRSAVYHVFFGVMLALFYLAEQRVEARAGRDVRVDRKPDLRPARAHA